MESLLPVVFASVAGLGHALEPDHVLAVSNMVSRRDALTPALRDGLFWGLGHTLMLALIGAVLLLGRVTFQHWGYFEALVGLVLIGMAVHRLFTEHAARPPRFSRTAHGWAFAVGLVHGLAGSGALVVLVLTEIRNPWLGLLYIVVFGLGSVAGMFGVAGLLSIPFTQRMRLSRRLRRTSVWLSSVVCILYGGWMVYSNLIV
ncbi:urease accessory protein [Hymenobacter nivis]|uniref:Urease accessory protein n=1 Tax=Hymenobacter nivis TaxID=1850093 RepID=A0A502HDK6_9BACT|nr:urease accessory protein [Hymenobacter nivis]TPG71762.1 urease accessory protein [Hymenobacter nivis]